MTEPLLAVSGLCVVAAAGNTIVDDVALRVAAGEILGVVGESGSGKTTTALALLGYVRPGVRITAGTVRVDSVELVGRSEAELRALRGKRISYVPQDPTTALNPAMRIGGLLREVLRIHACVGGAEADTIVSHGLERVGLPGTPEFQRRYRHQLSGGQQQRVAIAMALICNPAVIVFDEPTTGLDVITEKLITEVINDIRHVQDMGIVYVSHNLAVVATLCDRIAVMYAGRIVENGPRAVVLKEPKHPYTAGLIGAIPDVRAPRRLRGVPGKGVGFEGWASRCAFAPRCNHTDQHCESAAPELVAVSQGLHDVRCFHWEKTRPVERGQIESQHFVVDTLPALLEVTGLTARYDPRVVEPVVSGISFGIAPGECLALVGQSGSGKTTVARCLAGLHRPSGGEMIFDGAPLSGSARERPQEVRRRIQIVFQNPYESLNPRRRVDAILVQAIRFFTDVGRRAAAQEVSELLAKVHLPDAARYRYPRELSGGERQRVAIARALAASPDLLIADEITSALDTSVQATVLELLGSLQSELDLAVLMISHDLGVVSSVAARVLVMLDGTICEEGYVRSVLDTPRHAYTQLLVSAAPSLAEDVAPARV